MTATIQTLDLKVETRAVTCPECNGAQEIRIGPDKWCGCDECNGTGLVAEDFVRITADDIRRLIGATT